MTIVGYLHFSYHNIIGFLPLLKFMPPGVVNIFFTTDVTQQRRYRRLLSNPMSEGALRQMCPVVEEKVSYRSPSTACRQRCSGGARPTAPSGSVSWRPRSSGNSALGSRSGCWRRPRRTSTRSTSRGRASFQRVVPAGGATLAGHYFEGGHHRQLAGIQSAPRPGQLPRPRHVPTREVEYAHQGP